ncbi:plasma membrane SNARE protein (Sec9) [Metarhizium robertsii ARSEF 23]|uniref:Plasma membrane SNARE protein (Sec9) n=1 Tax=Metarhizium robertsii (strain ARSEF 23 / ATCC MYA-3075) TaxID=655844 RepID=A0A0B2XHB6_METRA|nr:plasma membrane SNARE protein (Sec9) [Metarhizium robertsii ARSEF 23]KHO11379.1 plasma membrane SNARE protein (Sec9) [Metarhizium robertsii ARSEF 23]
MSEVLWPRLQTLVVLARCQLWVSIGGSVMPHPDTAMMEGFARTLRSKQYGLHLFTLSLETPESMDWLTKIIQQIVDLNSTTSGGPRQYEQEYVEMDAILHT